MSYRSCAKFLLTICLCFAALGQLHAAKKIRRITISGASSLAYKKSTTMTCYVVYTDGSKAKVKPSWSLTQCYNWPGRLATISSNGVLTYRNISVNTKTKVIIRASYKGYSATKNVTLTNKSSGGGSSGGYRISGASTLKYGQSAKYYLYYNGKKVSASSVSWSRSGLCSMSDKGCYGLLKASSRPVGASSKVTVRFKYKGRTGTKTVTIKR